VGDHRAGWSLRYTRATDHTIVGERDMGDARLGYQDIMYAFFDRFLKGDNSNQMLDTMPKVRYFVMGLNQWKSSDTWPPKGASPMTFHLAARATRTRSMATVCWP
jgi:predicted acyl esterase